MLLNSGARGPSPLYIASSLLFGAAALTASSYAAIPIGPVPITMQTLVAGLLGPICGPVLGAAVVAFWLCLGAIGLPVFADGAGGASHLFGPTGGYLFAFVIAAYVSGHLWFASKLPPFPRGLIAMLAANALCLSLGGAWLSTHVGSATAIARGVVPFLPGALVKSALGAIVLVVLVRLDGKRTGESP